MPRLALGLIRKAASLDVHLPLLLRVCRDLPSARNELRWLKEHAHELASKRNIGLVQPNKTYPLKTVFESENSNRQDDLPSSTVAWTLTSKPAKAASEILDVTRSSKARNPDFAGHTSAARSEPLDKCYGSGRPIDAETHTRPARALAQPRKRRQGCVAKDPKSSNERALLVEMVRQRSRGKPLQYIIGTQPFGNLEINCPEGVLIPRPETETYVEHLANILSGISHGSNHNLTSALHQRKRLRMLDLCSGTGCIGLLLHSLLKPPSRPKATAPTLQEAGLGIEIMGVDINPKAINVARSNIKDNIAKGLLHPDAINEVRFFPVDVLQLSNIASDLGKIRANCSPDGATWEACRRDDFLSSDSWDVVIANPPYISTKDFAPGGPTEISVRKYEPKSALVPPDEDNGGKDGGPDQFYLPIMSIACALDANLILMEAGDTKQVDRVLAIAKNKLSPTDEYLLLESWRDDGSVREEPARNTTGVEGNASDAPDRAVVCWRKELGAWRRTHNQK